MGDLIDVFNEDDTRRGRVLTEIAHRMPWAITAAAVLEAPYYLRWEVPVVAVLQLVPVALIVVGIFHTSFARLCMRCLSEIPRDGAARATRHRWLLELFHAQRGVRLWLALLFVMVGTPVLIASFGLPRWLNLPVDAYWYAWLTSLWVHHRLRLWCPGCDDGDHGGWTEAPAPDPTTSATR